MDVLAHMDTFVRIVDAGTLSGAARSARLSLAAVSRQLSALEGHLGTPLIVRSTRRLSVTAAGQRFYDRARVALREAEEAMAEARAARSLTGRLAVTAPYTFGLHHVVPRLEAFTRKHPAIHVDLRLEDHAVDLVATGVDVAIRAGMSPPDSTAFVAHPLRTMQRWVVGAPAYLEGQGAPSEPRDLAKHRCLPQLGSRLGAQVWRFTRQGTTVEIEPRGPLRATAPAALLPLALSGAGLALLPDWLVTEHIAGGWLRRVLSEWETPTAGAWLVHRAELRRSPRIRAFIDAMR